MKKLILIAILATAFTCGLRAQDTINYIVVYQQLQPRATMIVGFRTQVTLTDFLNNTLDSTAAPTIYDIRTKKPLTATFSTVEVQRVVKDRQRKWSIK